MKLYHLVFLLFVSNVLVSQVNWVPSGPITNDNFTDITSSPNSTYYLSTYNPGKIYTSNNNGSSWSRVYISSSQYFTKVEFVNNQIGFAAGANNNNYPVILRTTNAGASWTSVSVPGTFRLNNSYVTDILFLNVNNGYATCSNGSLLETIDGGLNWQLVNTNGGTSTGAYEIIQHTQNTFFIAGGGSGTWLFDKTNSRLSRVGFHYSLTIDKGINDVFCLTSNEIALFPNGATNAFTKATNPLSLQVFPSILAVSDSILYICGNDRNIYRSIDGGNTLTQDLSSQSGSHLNEIDLLNGVVWAVGEVGQVFKRQNTVGEKELIEKKNELSIYPSPAKELLYIRTDNRVDMVNILDLNGKGIMEFSLTNNEIDISRLKSGIYFMQILSEGEIYTEKFMKL